MTQRGGPTAGEMADVSAQELARLAHSGCSDSFAELARRYRPRLLHILEHRLAGRLADAEDVAQEALIRAWKRIELYDDRYPFRAWLIRIALHLATDHQRRQRRSSSQLVLSEASEPCAHSGAAEAMQKQEASENLWATARRTLSVSQFTVLWLRYGEAMSIKEVAEATGRTTVGVRVLLHRARAALALQVNHRANTCSVESNDGRGD